MGGLIYVVIMAVWAVVLVPAWLRRHDHEDPSRSVDRFTRSMRQLATNPGVSTAAAPRPARTVSSVPTDPEVEVLSRPRTSQTRSGQSVSGQKGSGQSVSGQALSDRVRPRRRTAAARRRMVLLVLGAVLVGVFALVVSGIVGPVVLAVPVLAITGFLVMARAQVRSKTAVQRAPRSAAPEVQQEAAPSSRPSNRLGIHEDGTWDATAALLPRYVTAPPASAVPRVIDTETPGAWTAAAMLERAQQERTRAERMEQVKREAIARARAEQVAADARMRDEEYLASQAVTRPLRSVHQRAVNE